MTQQSARQATVRALTSTALTYEGDWHALFDQASQAVGPFNQRLLAWINAQLSAAYTEINGAMQAFAASQGAYNWSSMGAFTTSGGSGFVLMEDGSNVLTEDGGKVLTEH